MADVKRYVQVRLEHGCVVKVEAVLAEGLAVIARHDQERVVEQALGRGIADEPSEPLTR